MPKRIRKVYTKQFKLTAVHLMKSKLMRPKDIFELLGGIDRQTVYRWVKEYDAEGETAFSTEKGAISAKELNELQKQYQKLQMENEILKKAVAYLVEKTS